MGWVADPSYTSTGAEAAADGLSLWEEYVGAWKDARAYEGQFVMAAVDGFIENEVAGVKYVAGKGAELAERAAGAALEGALDHPVGAGLGLVGLLVVGFVAFKVLR